IELPGLEAGHRADDARAVARHPLRDDVEALDLLGRQAAVAARADVEQQVSQAPAGGSGGMNCSGVSKSPPPGKRSLMRIPGCSALIMARSSCGFHLS